ncbi:Probable Co/Zn/Cd efflux system membrane fusion protein [hydrothermal vent metagenome]|uniref:Probable Co/Zn/Cd efflux system membrane fusion protein n=1 Tax=hydrothermal vent metagenome TaxID=652676 RepID=A0A3B0UYK6_9ZZZZ
MEAKTVETGRKKKRSRWIIGAIAVFLVGVTIGVLTIRSNIQATRAEAEARTGDVVTAVLGDLAATASATGQVESTQLTNLSAETPSIVQEVMIRVGDTVQAGDVLVQLDTANLEFRVARMQQNLILQEVNLEALQNGATEEEIAAAEAAVISAQLNLENLLAGPTTQEIAESEANIRSQEANIASASASYNSTLDSVTDSAIATAQVELINAQIAYDSAVNSNEDNPNADTHAVLEDAATNLTVAQTALDSLLDGPNQGNISSSAASVSAAVANLEQTQANYNKQLLGTTASQIAASQASLAQAESTLDRLVESASAADIMIAEAEIEQAKLSLLDAEESLAKATIIAPFDGLVTAVNVTEGETGSGSLIQIISNSYQVILSVDEIDVGAIAPGQEAIITLETWPDVEISSEVIAIAPSANSSDGIIFYDVTLQLEESELPILVGMTANAKLITLSHDNVLLIPNAAITANRAANTYSVNLITDELNGVPLTEEVAITIGLADNSFTQIISGLSEGDKVLIGELIAPIERFGPGNGGGPFGDD